MAAAGEVTRRRFLAGAGAVAASGLMAASPRAWALGGADGSGEPLEFAVLADTHINPEEPAHSAQLADVYAHLGARPAPPAFTLHVGDVVEAGQPGEYEEWDRLQQQAPPGPMHVVRGNHEVRWDERACEPFFARFRRAPYSFDAGPLHVVALDPTQLLQEPGYVGADQLRWLEADLRRAEDRPTVVFQHYPVGGPHLYVGNQAELREVLSRFNIAAVFAGHIHRLEVNRQDGIAMIALPGILNVAVPRAARSGSARVSGCSEGP